MPLLSPGSNLAGGRFGTVLHPDKRTVSDRGLSREAGGCPGMSIGFPFNDQRQSPSALLPSRASVRVHNLPFASKQSDLFARRWSLNSGGALSIFPRRREASPVALHTPPVAIASLFAYAITSIAFEIDLIRFDTQNLVSAFPYHDFGYQNPNSERDSMSFSLLNHHFLINALQNTEVCYFLRTLTRSSEMTIQTLNWMPCARPGVGRSSLPSCEFAERFPRCPSPPTCQTHKSINKTHYGFVISAAVGLVKFSSFLDSCLDSLSRWHRFWFRTFPNRLYESLGLPNPFLCAL